MALKFVRKVNVILIFSLRIFGKFETSSGSSGGNKERTTIARERREKCARVVYNGYSRVELINYCTELLVSEKCMDWYAVAIEFLAVEVR